MTAVAAEVVLDDEDVWSEPLAIRGRVNVYIDDTSPTPWKGWVHVQRRFQKVDEEFVEWQTVVSYNTPGYRFFVEHEQGMQYRIGVPSGGALVGGAPYARLSQ